MKTIDDVLERLDGESRAMVVQLSAKECAEMAAMVRDYMGTCDVCGLEHAPTLVMCDACTKPKPETLWAQAVEAVRRVSPRAAHSLSFAELVWVDDDDETGLSMAISFPPEAAFHRSVVFGLSNDLIENTISARFSRPFAFLEQTKGHR